MDVVYTFTFFDNSKITARSPNLIIWELKLLGSSLLFLKSGYREIFGIRDLNRNPGIPANLS